MRVPALMLAGLLCVLVPARLRADPITVTVSGILDRTYAPGAEAVFGFSLAPGDPFTFAVSFDSDTASRGSFSLTFGTHETFTQNGAEVTRQLENDANTHLGIRLDRVSLSAGPDPGRVYAFVQASDSAGNWLTSDAWPTDVAAVLTAAPVKFFAVGYLLGDSGNTAFGVASSERLQFTQSSAAPTPEPTTVVLLGTAFAGVAARRWRQRARR